MKTCLLLFLLCLSTMGFGQLIHNSYKWNDLEIDLTACKGVNCLGGINYTTHSYHLGKDTIIDLKNYKVLTDTIYKNTYHYADTIGFIREEINTKKVFFFPKHEQKEILLYDFSLKLADEFILEKYWESAVFKVTSIDSIDYYGVKHLTITLIGKYEQTIQWIEGIGSVQGLLYNQMYEGLLLCVNDNDQLIYKNTQSFPCIKTGFVNAVNEMETGNAVLVYPNPASETVTIKSKEVIKTLELLDLYGNTIYSDRPNRTDTRLSLVRFKKGIYLLEINCEQVKLVVR